MEFITEAQKNCYEKIAPWMTKIFNGYCIPREDLPVFGVMVGSALVQVGVSPWNDENATITARSYVVTDVELCPDLLLYLLQENDHMRFGAFGVDKDGDIFFEHTIVGGWVDEEELKSSVIGVSLTADYYDDKIVERWGGQRMIERESSE
jgi:hypothetical protein